MAAVVLLITVASGIYATINLGTAESKYGANNLLETKVDQFYDEDVKDACKNAEYDLKNGEHTFTCSLRKKGGKKSRKTRRNRKSRRFRK
jgi:hypothetical protein